MALTRINNQALPTLDHSKMPSGSTLQVKSATSTTAKGYTSTTYAASGLKVSITPKYSNSKILILCDVGMVFSSATSSTEIKLAIYRDSTSLDTSTYGHFFRVNGNHGYTPVTFAVYDSPSTTSEVTYELYGKSGSNATTVYGPHDLSKSQITVMEIAG